MLSPQAAVAAALQEASAELESELESALLRTLARIATAERRLSESMEMIRELQEERTRFRNDNDALRAQNLAMSRDLVDLTQHLIGLHTTGGARGAPRAESKGIRGEEQPVEVSSTAQPPSIQAQPPIREETPASSSAVAPAPQQPNSSALGKQSPQTVSPVASQESMIFQPPISSSSSSPLSRPMNAVVVPQRSTPNFPSRIPQPSSSSSTSLLRRPSPPPVSPQMPSSEVVSMVRQSSPSSQPPPGQPPPSISALPPLQPPILSRLAKPSSGAPLRQASPPPVPTPAEIERRESPEIGNASPAATGTLTDSAEAASSKAAAASSVAATGKTRTTTTTSTEQKADSKLSWISTLRVVDLKQQLKSRGIEVTGKELKAELQDKLRKALGGA